MHWATFWGIFFTNSSGHPEGKTNEKKILKFFFHSEPVSKKNKSFSFGGRLTKGVCEKISQNVSQDIFSL
jgi:hypothetical protein